MPRALHALAIAALWLLLGSAAGLAQGVNVIGAVTPGHCVSFFSTSQIQDSGGTCGGGGGGGITGPGVSTVGDLAVWNNATGSALADTNLNFATPPAIGSTIPAAGAFTTLSATGNLTTNVTGSTQCLQVNTLGVVSGTGSVCAAGGGAVSSVSGTAGQITATPTTGAVVVSLPATITANLTLSGTVNHSGPFQIGGTTVALPIALANGGTNNATLTASAGGIVWSDASKLNILAGTSTPGLCLLSGNLTTPAWTTCPGGGGTPGGANTNIQFNASSAFGGDAGFTYAGNGQVTHALGTITTNLKALTITGTWNNVATTFDAPLFMNIINTASAAGSLLADFQVGGTSVLSLRNDGLIIGNFLVNGNATTALAPSSGTVVVGATATSAQVAFGSNAAGVPSSVIVTSVGIFEWSSSSSNAFLGAYDAVLARQAAGIVGLHQGTLTSPASFEAFNTSDVASGTPTNFELGIFGWTTTANTLTMGTQSGGTGTNRAALLTSSIGVSLSLATAKVVTVGDGAANANGWLQWGGEARVTSDFSVTSSVALVNVTGLSVNVAAGRTYSFVTELYVTDAAAGGVQAAIAGTATATAIQYTGYTIADNAIKGKTNAIAMATAVGSTVTTETAGIIVRISGTITVNAAGTLTVQMAQNTSNGTATTAKRGSWLLVNDMP